MANGILILANPKGKAWNFAKEVYEKLNSNPNRERKYSLGEVEITKFNDGEIFTKILTNVRKKTCFFIHDSSMPPQDWTISLAEINDALMRSSAGKINNVLPYIKYSRQDRMTEPRVPITTSILAKIISLSAYRIITTDLHNPAVTGSYNIPFDNLKAYPTIINHLKEKYPDFLENAIIVAPDVGSAERAKSYAKRLNINVAVADKSREKAGVVGEMTIIGDVQGKNAILVDDMIDTAGTLCKAAEVLKQKGALKVWACATHGILSKDAIEKINNSFLEKVIITDSIPQEQDGKIEVISLSTLFADVIYRISHGNSVSELFDS